MLNEIDRREAEIAALRQAVEYLRKILAGKPKQHDRAGSPRLRPGKHIA